MLILKLNMLSHAKYLATPRSSKSGVEWSGVEWSGVAWRGVAGVAWRVVEWSESVSE